MNLNNRNAFISSSFHSKCIMQRDALSALPFIFALERWVGWECSEDKMAMKTPGRPTEAALWSVLTTKYYSGDQIKNEMGAECSRYGRLERCIQSFGGETWGKTDRLEDLSLDSRIILKRICQKWDEGAWAGLIWLRTGTGGGRL